MVTPAEPVLKTKMEDMGSLRGPRQKKAVGPKYMDPMQILARSVTKELGPQADVNKTLNQISSIIGLGLAKIVQLGNTVFLIIPKGGQTAEFHTATEEPLSELPNRFKSLANTLKQMGFRKAVSYAPSPSYIKIAKQTGLPVRTTQGKQQIGRDSKPMYQFMVDL